MAENNAPKGNTKMTDLAKIITDSVSAIATPESIRAKVDKHIDDLVQTIIRDELRSYGDIGKQIKAALQDSLKVNDLNIPSYGETVTAMLREQIEKTVQPLISKTLADDMAELLNLAPPTIKLSKIVEEMMQANHAYQDGEYGDLVTCIVDGEPSDSCVWVYLDEEEHRPDHEKYRCSHSILVRNDGTIASGSAKGQELSGKSRRNDQTTHFGRTWGLSQKLLAYYATGTVIELDVENVSTYRDYD